MNDTICAITTPVGTSAIGVIKVSGPQSIAVVERIFRPASKSLSEKEGYTMTYGWVVDPKTDERIDDAIAAIYRTPHSYTGEDVVELSLHGSPLILSLVMDLLMKNGARLAEPGEFTRRAFAAGKMDLSQAEAVADVIGSSSRAALRMSLTQMRGHFRDKMQNLRDELISFASLLELELDFSEEDVNFVSREELQTSCERILTEVESLRDSYRMSQVIKNGIPIAIVGQTNAGKSTLLNHLLREERAIVSDIHGTTRDTIEDTLLIDGIQFRIIDTAGIRQTTDEIENIGIQRAYEKASQASLILWLIDPTEDLTHLPEVLSELKRQLRQSADSSDQSDISEKIIPILNKSDKATADQLTLAQHKLSELDCPTPLIISAQSAEGIKTIQNLLSGRFSNMNIEADQLLVTNLRQAEALTNAAEALRKVIDGLTHSQYSDLIAQDLRTATGYLSQVIGEVTTEDLLSSIFSNFCIGK